MASVRLVLTAMIAFAGCAKGGGGSNNGNEGSGGGSGSAAEFSDIGYKAVKVLGTIPKFPVKGGDFEAAVKSTHVEFVDQVLHDPNGLVVDALNYPDQKLIRVNLQRWLALAKSPADKYQLVVHEYLGILRIDDSGYRVSNLVLYGGIRLWSVICRYTRGAVDYHIVDLTGGGQIESDAKFVNSFGSESPVVIGPIPHGVILSWADRDGMETISLPDYRSMSAGRYLTTLYLQIGFDSTHAPAFQANGTVSCLVTTPDGKAH
jgi:hypothetical protein